MKVYTNRILLDVIGLRPPATEAEIKKAYRHLALEYHPDKNAEGADRFIEITKAYDALLALPNPEPEPVRPKPKSSGSSSAPCQCDQCLLGRLDKFLSKLPDELFDVLIGCTEKELVGVVDTKRGERILATSKPSKEFWELWREDKDYIKDHSISVSKDTFTGKWNVCLWIPFG